jgi:hypothetical protein
LEKKAGLYEGTPEEGKAWYQSKTILAAIVLFLVNAYYGISKLVFMIKGVQFPEIPEEVLAGLAMVLGPVIIQGRIDANKPIVLDPTEPPIK